MIENGNAKGSVEIGVVGRPHGVQGALHVFLHNPASEILNMVGEVRLAASGAATGSSYRVLAVHRAGKHCILALEGVDSREQAEALNGTRVLVPRSALPHLGAGEYYVHDLIGLEVRSKGRVVGTVFSSRAQHGIEVLTVRGDAHDVEIPLVDDFIVVIDLPAARIEVKDIDDLPRHARSARRDSGV